MLKSQRQNIEEGFFMTKKVTEDYGVQYRKASKLSMCLGIATKGTNLCFYLLMMYASYIANVGFGIGVALAGMIITGTRIFDGITDPILAAWFDRMTPGKHGKIRKCIFLGWFIMAIADITMFNLLSGVFSGAIGILVFVAIYVVHIIGYTILNMCTGVIGTVITNDPVQRPFVNLVGTIYSYITPMVLNTLLSFVILPKYNNQYDAACLKEACFWYIGAGLIFVVISCIGCTSFDNEEVLGGITTGGKNNKIGIKDMWSLLKDNKALRLYIITGASDKIAQQTASQSIVATMMSGILIANFKAATMIGNTSMVVGLIFGVLGGAYIAKKGCKKAVSVWSIVAILLAGMTFIFCLILGPTGMKNIGIVGPIMFIYVAIMIVSTGVRMILSTAEGTMKADVTDYELERSGNYMPGTVSGVYNFVDKLISSLAATIAAFGAALIGYKTTMPQMGDTATWPLFWLTMILMFGFPVFGWICNILAMRKYELSKERMVEVQKNIADKKAAAKAKLQA